MRRENRRSARVASLAAGGVVLLVGGLGVAITPAGAEPGEPTGTTSVTAHEDATVGLAAADASPSGSATPSASASPTGPTSSTGAESPTAPDDVPTTSEEPEPTASPTPSGPTTPPATAEPDEGELEVDDAVFRWGVNNESNNRAFAPGTFNFFSAGKVPDPGRGGVEIPRSRWRQARGNVGIEKWNGRAWRPATWAGLRTDSSGQALGAPTAGTFSNHTFVIRGGEGTVDPAAGAARITWDGDVTLIYYSGMSFFYLSDPVLTVANGTGRVTATVGGYASSVADPTQWAPVPSRQVTVAELPQVDLSDERGFVAEPAYRGVPVTGVPQRTDGPDWGAFPQSFVDYMDRLGTAAFWYSSGAATDPFKVPLPVTVSYDAGSTVPQPTPSAQPSATEDVDPPEAVAPPPAPSAPVAPPAPPALPAVEPPVASLPASVPLTVSELAAFELAPRPATQLRLTSAGAVDASPDAARTPWLWWSGGAVLLLAAVLLLLPAGRPGRP